MRTEHVDVSAPTGPSARDRVTADDVRAATGWLAALVAPFETDDLDAPSSLPRRTPRRTVEAVVDDLIAYALQLAALPRLAYVPIVGPGGEQQLAHVDPASGAPGLAEAVTAAGELLAAQVQARTPDARAYHPDGLADPEGFAAMGAVELLVHGYDVATATGGVCPPFPAGVADRALTRLFPDAPAFDGSPDADARLLWATGRIALGGQDRRYRWRWEAAAES